MDLINIDIERVSAANEWDIECEHEKINSVSLSVHVLFCLLYKHTNNVVYDDFPKISEHFSKIVPKAWWTSPKIFRRLPKITEDCRRWPKISEEVPMTFRSYNTTFKRLCSYSNGNLKACDNNSIFLHVKLWYFYMWKYMVFLSRRNPDETLVFI